MEHGECVRLVKKAFEGLPVGSGPDHGVAHQSSSATEMVYGELTFAGMQTLHDTLNMRRDDILYDLGSGVGKFVLYAALRAACASVKGVEVGMKRHATAEKACARLAAMLSEGDTAAPPAASHEGASALSSSRTVSRARARLHTAMREASDKAAPSPAPTQRSGSPRSSAAYAARRAAAQLHAGRHLARAAKRERRPSLRI